MDDLGMIIVATGFEKLPKVQQIAQSGHTEFRGYLKMVMSLNLGNCHRVIKLWN